MKIIEKRRKKLYKDVTDVIMDTRISIAKLYPRFNGDELDKMLFDMQLKVGDKALKSLEEKL